MQRSSIIDFLENFFLTKTFSKDPQMGQFVPMVYEKIGFNYKEVFEPDFTERFDGLMLKGADEVENIYGAVFPTPDVIEAFLQVAQKGDVFFSHHPIYIENGDPQKGMGRGWLPLTVEQIQAFREKGLTYFSCHSPMDYHLRVGTRAAMMDALECLFLDHFFNDGTGPHGLIGVIPTCTAQELSEKLMRIFNVPYLDSAGAQDNRLISKVAIIAGGADNVEYMEKAQRLGVDAYICGEFNSRFDTPWGHENQKKVDGFLESTNMTFLGVSHAACEYLTFREQLQTFFEHSFPDVRVHMLEQERWWF